MTNEPIDEAYASVHCACRASKNLQKPFCTGCYEALWQHRPGIAAGVVYHQGEARGYAAYEAAVEYLKHAGRIQ